MEDGNVRKEEAHAICTQSKGLALERITHKSTAFNYHPFDKHRFREPGRVASLLFCVFLCFLLILNVLPSSAIAFIFFGPLCPRTAEALFGILLAGSSANSGGARGVPFYIITDDLQAHNFHFRQNMSTLTEGPAECPSV